MAKANGLLAQPAPTWGVIIAAVVIAVLVNGPRWISAFTKRQEFLDKRERAWKELDAKLAAKQAKIAAQSAPKAPPTSDKRR